MTMTLDGSNGVTFNDASLQGAAASPYVLKNRIINGDMRIDQRNAGASLTNVASANTYTVDRWQYYATQASKFTIQQNQGSVTPPAGFSNYLGITSSSSYSIVSSDIFILQQIIEGFNIADLAWGTANAKTITISFWVRSSLTGTFGGALYNNAGNRSYPFTYTISSANTWTQISVTIAGDTSGTWTSNNTGGIYLDFNLGAGSTYQGTAGSWQAGIYTSTSSAVNILSTNGATFYITGVQLELGSTATPFERRLYNQELANCQRYYESISFGAYRGITCQARGANDTNGWCGFKVTKRASPTMAATGTFGAWTSTSPTNSATLNFSGISVDGSGLDVATSGMTAGNASLLTGNPSASITASIEL